MDTILDVVAKMRKVDPPLRYLEIGEDVGYGKFLEFDVGHWDGKPQIVPSEALNLPGRAGHRSFLYRGQAVRYPSCKPSVLRGVADDERLIKAHLILERIRVAELELLFRDHPFSDVAASHGVRTDYHGLAQHYGIPTSLLNLTSNVEIAAFFAVARWDSEAQVFTPMEAGVGVLYRFDWTAFGPGYSRYFTPVGFGPGLQPARQHAWTFMLQPGVDFEHVPHVAPIEFAHSARASAELFANFGNGSWFYPPDCVASLVKKVRDLPFVTMRAIRHATFEDGKSADELVEDAERSARFLSTTLGTKILDCYELQLEDDDVEISGQQAVDLDKAIRATRTGWRIIRERNSKQLI